MQAQLLMLSSVALVASACRDSEVSGNRVATVETDRVTHSVVAPPPPCTDCTIDVPRVQRGPLPLLVVMHGDHENARKAASRWRDAALARGWAVLGLQCPRADGCADEKWYEWTGGPAWVTEQVAEVGRAIDLDQRRVYLIGWSGGASFIGMHAPKWEGAFAAVVLHGGGQPPADEACPQRLPAYFLVGDQNPAHGAAVKLREYLERCNQEIQWDLLPGATHKREEAALDRRKASEILQWLDQRARPNDVS